MMSAARDLTLSLAKGRWCGNYGIACCPAHNDRHPSLTIRDGDTSTLLRCKAGCEPTAVIRAIGGIDSAREPPKATGKPREKQYERLSDWGHAFWHSCAVVMLDTPAGRYLEARGCELPHIDGDLRWHPNAFLNETYSGPALVALVGRARGSLRHPEGRGCRSSDAGNTGVASLELPFGGVGSTPDSNLG